MYINFQQTRVSRSVGYKPCTQIYLQIIASCINLQIPIVILKKKTIFFSDIHHRIMYAYINFQQNRVSRSVKKVHTNIFANNRKLHKFANTNSNLKKKFFSDIHHRITYVYINFQQNRVRSSVQTVHTNIFANNRKLHTFATTNSILKNEFLKTFISG